MHQLITELCIIKVVVLFGLIIFQTAIDVVKVVYNFFLLFVIFQFHHKRFLTVCYISYCFGW